VISLPQTLGVFPCKYCNISSKSIMEKRKYKIHIINEQNINFDNPITLDEILMLLNSKCIDE